MKKNKFGFNQKRYFKLHRDGHLLYEDKNKTQVIIPITLTSKVTRLAKDKFEVKTPQREFVLTEADTSKFQSGEWIDRIQEVIQSLEK